MNSRTVGIEEEFLLVDPADGRPRALSAAVLDAASETDGEVDSELQMQQVETATRPCRSLDELAGQVRAARRGASDSARRLGAEIAALGTSPMVVQPVASPGERYQRMAARFGYPMQDQLSCACHVHVEVESEDEAVAVLDRIRPRLAPLLALTANSPFWQGRDTTYASYRSEVWARWPSAGPTGLFGTPATYHDTVRAVVESATVLDAGMVYFDARLSARYPTVEIRVADVCVDADDAVLLAALTRGLVETAAREWAEGKPADPVRTEVLRLARWRASRSGLDGELIQPGTSSPAPALEVLDLLLAHVREALEDLGDYAATSQLRDAILRRGNGAARQRAEYARSGQLCTVVDDAIQHTLE